MKIVAINLLKVNNFHLLIEKIFIAYNCYISQYRDFMTDISDRMDVQHCKTMLTPHEF